MGETHFASLEYLCSTADAGAKAAGLLEVSGGVSDKTAKEVQMFGLASWLTGRFRMLFGAFLRGEQATPKEECVAALLSIVGMFDTMQPTSSF